MRKYIKKLKTEIFIRLFFHLIYIAAIAALPYVIKDMIDCDYENGIYDVIKWILIFILFVVIGMGAQYITQKNAWKLSKKLFVFLREDLFESIISKTPEEFQSKNFGDFNSMLNNDINACDEYMEYLMEIFEAAIGLLVYAMYIFLLDYRIAIIIYIVAIVTLFLPNLTGERLSLKKQILLGKTGKYNTKVLDLLGGYFLVNKDTCSGISRRHATVLGEMENARYDYGKYKSFTNVLNGSVMYVVNTSAFAIIAILLFQGNITAGVATATIAYVQDFMFPLRTIIDSISNVKSVAGAKDDVLEEIEKKKEMSEVRCSLEKEIVFQNVSFKYHNFAIKNFSAKFEKGKKYAIIGGSGKGKSTILKLLTGHIVPDTGKVTMDGKRISYEVCRNTIMYVEQKSHIFLENFHNNATVFGSYNDIESFENFIPVTKTGRLLECVDCSMLSGGEQQLVSLLRALASGRDVWVLDEPFSALDKELEMELCKKILKMKDKTIIMVTHNESKEFLSMFDAVIEL